MNTLYDFYATPGRIYVLDGNEVDYAEDILLNMVARLRFDTRSSSSLTDSVKLLQKENKMVSYDPIKYKTVLESKDGEELKFFNNCIFNLLFNLITNNFYKLTILVNYLLYFI